MLDVSPPNWDEALRLTYPLTEDSIVIDAGAYDGGFSQAIWDKYKCNIIALEPVAEFCHKCRQRFENIDKIAVMKIGLSAGFGMKTIYVCDVASSRHTVRDVSELALFFSLKDFVRQRQIGLLKLNIEGSEFEVLEDIVKTGVVNQIDHIQVQYHDVPGYTPERLLGIRTSLEQTHCCDWRWGMTWESWSRKAAGHTA